jgi:O-acetyl-ADP-ribose deacetylase (regulator of RNase III)
MTDKTAVNQFDFLSEFIQNNSLKSLLLFDIDSEAASKNQTFDAENVDLSSLIKYPFDQKISRFQILFGSKSVLFHTSIFSSAKSETQYQAEKLNLVHALNQYFSNELKLNVIHREFSGEHDLALLAEFKQKYVELLALYEKDVHNFIENKSGLKTFSNNNQTYLIGYLFQFQIFEKILIDFESKRKVSLNLNSDNSEFEWFKLYQSSEHKLNLSLKSEKSSNFSYDIYIFQADLTHLDTESLVNVTNCDLHPGYDGEGISRRVREKGGKHMQDALKKILHEHRQNQLNDSDVVITKSNGKLKSKYILHAVAPTWHKYIVSNSTHDPKLIRNFEPVFEKTLLNTLNYAHELKLSSIGYPSILLDSTDPANVGSDAFDTPIELFAHLFFTTLTEYDSELKNTRNNIKLCITSLESEKVKKLCDEFSNLFDMYKETKWAMPNSPMQKLLCDLGINVDLISENETEHDKHDSSSSSSSTTSSVSNPSESIDQILLGDKVEKNLVLSSSSNSSLVNQNEVIMNSSCLFCQREEAEDSIKIVKCGNTEVCKSRFCFECMSNYLRRQNSNKCPSCKQLVSDESLLSSLRSQESKRNFSNSSSVNGNHNNYQNRKFYNNTNNNTNTNRHENNVNSVHSRLSFPSNHPNNQSNRENQFMTSSSSHNTNKISAVTDGQIYVRILNKPCEGYENYKSLLVTFDIPDGIQNVIFTINTFIVLSKAENSLCFYQSVVKAI